MKAFVFGLIIGVIIVPLAVYFWFGTGSAPVATAAPPMPFERMMAHRALNARISKEMPKSIPSPRMKLRIGLELRCIATIARCVIVFRMGRLARLLRGCFPSRHGC
jgi:hypothetical protein